MAPVRWHAVRSPLLVMLLATVLGGCCAVATVEVTTDDAGDGPPAQSRTAQSDSRQRQLTEGSSASSLPGTPAGPAPASTPSSSINATINRCREGCLEKKGRAFTYSLLNVPDCSGTGNPPGKVSVAIIRKGIHHAAFETATGWLDAEESEGPQVIRVEARAVIPAIGSSKY
ncbi:hypothetical protein ZHAS_00017036 [Anopheles sinensis]|uniref:Uncharacterized protein n=1 Tax=Anopheles sinensis TaxID=74873 RepID=A0A084WFN2_ANOSI|nr:hypothetical protein ZHAS_00017036 [Anopheles sinensis]